MAKYSKEKLSSLLRASKYYAKLSGETQHVVVGDHKGSVIILFGPDSFWNIDNGVHAFREQAMLVVTINPTGVPDVQWRDNYTAEVLGDAVGVFHEAFPEAFDVAPPAPAIPDWLDVEEARVMVRQAKDGAAKSQLDHAVQLRPEDALGLVPGAGINLRVTPCGEVSTYSTDLPGDVAAAILKAVDVPVTTPGEASRIGQAAPIAVTIENKVQCQNELAVSDAIRTAVKKVARGAGDFTTSVIMTKGGERELRNASFTSNRSDVVVDLVTGVVSFIARPAFPPPPELWWQKADREAAEKRDEIVQAHRDLRHFLRGE